MYLSIPKHSIVITDCDNAVNKVLKLLEGKNYRLRYTPRKVELIYKYDVEICQLLKKHGIKYTKLFKV